MLLFQPFLHLPVPWFQKNKCYSSSPYNYALDNPIIYIDPDGNQVELCCNWEKILDAINVSIGVSAGVGLGGKVGKYGEIRWGATIADLDYSLNNDQLTVDFLGINATAKLGNNIDMNGKVTVSTLELENFNNLFDFELPDFKSYTFLGAKGKAKFFKVVDAKGKVWLLKRDADGNWDIAGGEHSYSSSDEVFKGSDIAGEFKFIGKLTIGLDLSLLVEGITESDEDEGEDTQESSDSNNGAKSNSWYRLMSLWNSLVQGNYFYDPQTESWVIED